MVNTAMTVDTDILLVDDDWDTCASMSDIFLDLDYTVDTANDGPAALELSVRRHYRLALLDFKMPGMNGVELGRRLKESQPSVVVVLITAFSSIATTAAAAEAGIRCSLLKPVDFSVLMPLVDQIVDGSADRKWEEEDKGPIPYAPPASRPNRAEARISGASALAPGPGQDRRAAAPSASCS